MSQSIFKPLRIAFMGTPDFVIPTIEAIKNSAHELVAIYTQPPREKGRKKLLQPTPVHEYAEEEGIESRCPINFKNIDDVQSFEDLNLDVAIVAAYGLLLPQEILDAPKHGCINIHPSLLPRWRGPSPIQYAIWKGDQETGVSVMSLEKKMDAGPLLAQVKVDIAGRDFQTLNIDLWAKGTKALVKVLDDLSRTGALDPVAQNHDKATYCKLLTKENGKIDWTQTAQEIDCQIRGLNPWPGTWCFSKDSKRIKILKASALNNKSDARTGEILPRGQITCGGQSVLQLEIIQPENKKAMNINAAINGGHLKVLEVLR
jgi:methionyl-tRNA formyltransferase